MRIDVLTIFPDYLAPLSLSLPGKARDKGLLDLHVHDLRSWATDRHHTVDDTPYGGGAGMVMKPGPWGEALDAAGHRPARPSSSHPERRAVHPGAGPRAVHATTAWSSRAGATRGSTSGSSTTPPRSARYARSRWATTSSTAARSPRSRSPRPWSACCPASWATPSHWSRSRRGRPAGVPRLHQARGAGAATTSPRCCSGHHAGSRVAPRPGRTPHRRTPSRTWCRRPRCPASEQVLRGHGRRTRGRSTPCSGPAGSRSYEANPGVTIPALTESLDDVAAGLRSTGPGSYAAPAGSSAPCVLGSRAAAAGTSAG